MGAGLALAMAIAGRSFTALVAGACLGVAVAAAVEAAAWLRWGRWLADQSPPAAVAPRAEGTPGR
jgi:hypothetical protein